MLKYAMIKYIHGLSHIEYEYTHKKLPRKSGKSIHMKNNVYTEKNYRGKVCVYIDKYVHI